MQEFPVISPKFLGLALAGALLSTAASAEPIDPLAAFRNADANTDYEKADGPRKWYRDHISGIQRSTPIIGCGAGATLAAGGTWLQRAGGCVAGGFALSTIAPMIDPLKAEGGAASNPIDDLFSALPRRDAGAAGSMLAGSLDAGSRRTRAGEAQSQQSYRRNEIAERQAANARIWDAVIGVAATAAVTYIAADAANDVQQTSAVQSSRSTASLGNSGSSIPVTVRDAQGRVTGGYAIPTSSAEDGDIAVGSGGSRKTGIKDANGCLNINFETPKSQNPTLQYYVVRNTCGYAVKRWHNFFQKNGRLGYLDELQAGEDERSWVSYGVELENYVCPSKAPTGEDVHRETLSPGNFVCYYMKRDGK